MSSTTRSIGFPDVGKRWNAAVDGISLPVVSTAIRRTAAVFALFFLSCLIGLSLYGFAHGDRIYEGVSAGGVEIGGMTTAEARSAIEQQYRSYLDQPVSLTYGSETFTVVPSQAGISLDVNETVEEAFAFGREGGIFGRTQDWARAMLRGHDKPVVLSVNEGKLDKVLIKIAPSVAAPPANAFIQMNASEPTIVAEVPGVAFDLGATRGMLLDQVTRQDDAAIAIAAPPIEPAIKGDDLVPQLAEVQTAVGSTLLLSGADRYWAVSQDDLKRIVSAPGPGLPVTVNEDAVREFVRGIADEIEHGPIDARLIVNDSGDLQVVPGAASVDVNVNSSVKAIVQALTSGSHEVDLTIKREAASISDQQAQDAKVRAEALVADGLKLTWKSGGSAELSRRELIAALTVEPKPGEDDPIVIGFSSIVLGNLLQPIIDSIDVEASNGRYRYVDNVVKLVEKGSNGQEVDREKSTSDIVAAIFDGKGSATLTIKTVKPEFSNTNAKKIQLNDVLGTSVTYYGNSSDARRKNVERAVELESGWLVAPGDVFSYYQNIGKVDEDHGFVTGLGILSDGAGGITTAPVVGGGICQVSTTIFQSAFWAGLQIVDRTAHPYWLQNYGQPPTGMKGLDAMVDIVDDPNASLDMQFRNTTGNWIAVVMTADGENVYSEIRGTSQGWTVTVDGGGPTISKLVDPPTETMYQDSPELPAGEEKQVETAQQGFDTTIVRLVKDRDGNVIDQYTLTSTYVPSVNRILRGTGTS